METVKFYDQNFKECTAFYTINKKKDLTVYVHLANYLPGTT
jgi:hypothetical protein